MQEDIPNVNVSAVCLCI